MKVRATTVAGPPGTNVGDWLSRPSHRRSSVPTLVRAPDHLVVAVAGDAATVGPALPAGAATAEAVLVRARRAGAEVDWTRPQPVDRGRDLVRLAWRRGRSSVEVTRADPSLLTELQLGSWTEAGWRTRALRRLFARRVALPLLARAADRAGAETVGLAADLAFWSGVRAGSSRAEWQRWTRSYVVLNYHRISDDRKDGQELIAVPPARFAAQMRMLRVLGFRPLDARDMTRVHEAAAACRRRRFVVTADDGFLDCTEPLRRAQVAAQLFVPTSSVGMIAEPAWYHDHPSAGWRVDGEALADWDRLREIEQGGVSIGGHGHRHVALSELDEPALHDELERSRADLARELDRPLDALAYPHGMHDERVRRVARDTGFRFAYTTQYGRNGAGTDPWCLRRVPVFRDDGLPTVLWKVLTGEPPPARRRPVTATAGRADRP